MKEVKTGIKIQKGTEIRTRLLEEDKGCKEIKFYL